MEEKQLEQVIMSLIVESGEAKSSAFEAIQKAKEADFEAAHTILKESAHHLLEAHHQQTELLQKEAGGDKTEVSLLMVHAQDHLMTALTVKDLAKEFIDLYEKVDKLLEAKK